MFISHVTYYDEVAREIGRYLSKVVGVDIYLALQDPYLARAVNRHDHKRIVEHIEEGIRNSTHLLGLLGEKTRDSWWVPFELGAARQRNKPIGYLVLEEIDELPSFLRIADRIEDDVDLRKWVRLQLRSFIVEELRKSLSSVPRPSVPHVPIVRYRPVYYR